MGANIWFWIIYVICVLFTGWSIYPAPDYRSHFPTLVTFVLIGLLGWGVFGPPIR